MLQAIKALSPDHKLLNRLSRWTWSCRNFGGARHQRQWPKIRVLYLEEHWEVQLGHSTQAQLEALDFRGLMVILVEDAEWSELWLKYCTSLTHDFWQTEVITKVIAVRTGPCGPTTCHWVQRGGEEWILPKMLTRVLQNGSPEPSRIQNLPKTSSKRAPNELRLSHKCSNNVT